MVDFFLKTKLPYLLFKGLKPTLMLSGDQLDIISKSRLKKQFKFGRSRNISEMLTKETSTFY